MHLEYVGLFRFHHTVCPIAHSVYRTTTAMMRLSIEASLRADAFALRKLAEYADGKVILWSWASRGLISMEWIANLYHNGDVEAATESLSRVRGKLASLCNFNELPIVDGAEDTQDPEPAMLEGEVLHFWAISDPSTESEPIPLPLWMRPSIDRAILKWRNQAAMWEERIEKRKLEQKSTLPPKQQKTYEDFVKSKKISIVLDKHRKAEVMNVADKSIQKLRKTCLLLVIHMSDDAEQLGMTTGCGKLWKLQLLQQSKPITDTIPVELDHFSGSRV